MPETHFERVLICTDLSNRSLLAVRRGRMLARDLEAKVTILCVLDEDSPLSGRDSLSQAAHQEIEKQVQEEPSSQIVEIIVEIGDAVRTIPAIAQQKNADLIVLGVHRQRPFLDMFLSTTMEKLVAYCGKTFLIVSDDPRQTYQRVLCGIDLSPACVKAAKEASILAPQAATVAFHAFHNPFRAYLSSDGESDASSSNIDEARSRLDTWWAEVDIPQALEKPVPISSSVSSAFSEYLV